MFSLPPSLRISNLYRAWRHICSICRDTTHTVSAVEPRPHPTHSQAPRRAISKTPARSRATSLSKSCATTFATSTMLRLPTSILAIVVALGLARAHTVITYPGWRGNSLQANGTVPEENPDSRGIDYITENGTYAFPWGMQWMYPCAYSHTPRRSEMYGRLISPGGGMPQSTNRTKWPVSGGALSVQPGWFPGHSKAMFYVNIGIQEEGQLAPPNMSHPVVPPFQITGPTNVEYDGSFCLPQIGMPKNVRSGWPTRPVMVG